MKYFLRALPCCLLILFCACSTEISVRRVDRSSRSGHGVISPGRELLPETANLLANHLLTEFYENSPQEFLRRLRLLFITEPSPDFIAAFADSSLNIAERYKDDPDTAIGYALTSALAAYIFLSDFDHPDTQPYSAYRVHIIQIYNKAVTDIFEYLHSKKLYRKNAFALHTALGPKVDFKKAEYHLPLDIEKYSDFKLCADYMPENLTHISRHFGIGAPLIGELEPSDDPNGLFASDQTLPVTVHIHFDFDRKIENISARLIFSDTRNNETCTTGKHNIPLAKDFSTPIAYMAKRPIPFGDLSYMLNPEKSKHIQGLYKFEPFSEKRIPVVLVHGLMSNTRTWIQMLNTLQNDPDIRRHYQFWGFSYSSGNPILFSSSLLRKALCSEREKLLKSGKPVGNFDRMVLIGHSMGGLLSKTALINTGGQLLKKVVKNEKILKKITPHQHKVLAEHGMEFEHLPFVRRVIFIAVPHRGSEVARTFIGKIGSKLIRLPQTLIAEFGSIINTIFAGKSSRITGIGNLAPDNRSLNALLTFPFVKGVPFHSIIGNEQTAGIPGGSDGVVPYSSSHLDGAESELIVRSGHSVQQNPLAIQEVRRILLQHLKENSVSAGD